MSFQTQEEVDKYLNQDVLQCLICGNYYRSLYPHILHTHNMPVNEYKRRFGIPKDSWLVSIGTKEKMGIATQPVYRTKPVKKFITYWDCSYGHRHRTEKAAQECIEKRERVMRKKEIAVSSVRRWIEGESYRKIAKDIGYSPQAIGYMIQMVEKQALKHGYPVMWDKREQRESLRRIIDVVAEDWRVEG